MPLIAGKAIHTTTKKTYMNTIGIFNGKQKIHNTQTLTLLYNSEPLTTWEMANKLTNVGNRRSLNSTLNKSMRKLETKGYVRRKDDDKWYLKLKGFIAVLLIQPEPKKWNNKWRAIFMNELKINENDFITGLTNLGFSNIKKISKDLNEYLDNFENWVAFSKIIEKKKIDIDELKDQTLVSMLISEDQTLLKKFIAENFFPNFQKPIF